MTMGKAHAEAIRKLTMGFFSVKGRSMINCWCGTHERTTSRRNDGRWRSPNFAVGLKQYDHTVTNVEEQ